MQKTSVPKATLGRLPMYLQYLKGLSVDEVPNISATTIAKDLELGDVQVRKDLASVCGGGKPKIGYDTKTLIQSIEKSLGCDNITLAVLVGAGKLGKALLEFDDFETYGVKIIAGFDVSENPVKVGKSKEILPMNNFDEFCKENKIQIGIITVGEDSAQSVCDAMVKNGITAIWNFAPHKLSVPEGILLKQENLALSLAHLNNQLVNKF